MHTTFVYIHCISRVVQRTSLEGVIASEQLCDRSRMKIVCPGVERSKRSAASERIKFFFKVREQPVFRHGQVPCR